MLRRRHKKSRAGCLECKRRHVKCDERRPVCSLCRVSERSCTFAAVPLQTEFEHTDDGDNDSLRQDGASPPSPMPPPRTEPAAVPALPVFLAPSPIPPSDADTDALLLVDDTDAAINVSHAELIVHLMTNADIQSLAASSDNLTNGMTLGMRVGIRTPYLLYAMLAFSARHLAYVAAQGGDDDSPQQGDPQPSAVFPSTTPPPSSSSSFPSLSSSSTSSPSPFSSATSPNTAPQLPLPSAAKRSSKTSAPASESVSGSGSVPPYVSPSASSAARYQRQAVLLQTRAISLFNTACRAGGGVVDQTNCVPMLLFSSMLAHHLFADSLARRDDADLDTFLQHYVQCAQLQQGVYNIATATWPFLLVSEFAPILLWSARFTSREARGSECHQLLALIEQSPASRLSAADKDACRGAIRLLQVGFDVLFLPEPKTAPGVEGSGGCGGGAGGDAEDDKDNDDDNDDNDAMDETADGTTNETGDTETDDKKAGRHFRHKMILLWALIMPKGFADLLAAKTPEALVILAYYAWLLHHGQHLWQVGDAGAYIMGIVSSHLGPAWDNWLAYPRHRMATDVVDAQSP